MTARIFAVITAMGLALSGTTALAQPAFARFDHASLMDHSQPFRPYDQANAVMAIAAYVGDGSNPNYLRDQQQLLEEFGYSSSNG